MTARPIVASYCATFLKPEMLHIYRQIAGLRTFEPVIFCQKRENAERFPLERVQVIPRGAGRWLRRLVQRQLLDRPVTLGPRETRSLRAAIERVEPAVLHVYFGHIAVQLQPLFDALPTLPRVVSFHGADVLVDLDKPNYRAAALRMLASVDLALARSQSLIDALVALGCPPEKLRLHRTGIPLADFPFQPRTPPPNGEWRLLQACRLIEKKGLPTTLRAFAKFAARHPRARLTLAGEGHLEQPLRALAAELGVADRVHFPGFLTQPDLRRAYYDAHLFVHPSELGADGNQEGVPNSLLEAMAAGLPVFATRHGGIPEAVEHEVSGWLGPEGDADALAAALLKAAADWPAWGRAASEAVAEKFEQSAQVAKLESLYREAIKLRR